MDELDQRGQHPVAHKRRCHSDSDELGDESESCFLNLGHRLKDGDDKTEEEGGGEHRKRDEESGLESKSRGIEGKCLVHFESL